MSHKKYVSVIVPTYRDWERLSLCLEALNEQTYPRNRYEVIVVNNDPSNNTKKYNYSMNFRIISEYKAGSYAARNAGLYQAKGEIVAFTDSDCIPDKNWISAAVQHLNNGAERIAGRIDVFYETTSPSWVEIYEKAFAFNQVSNAAAGRAVTANMITWKKHFVTVGKFNDNLMSGGDNEWSYRAQDHTIPLTYCHDVIVQHPARANFKQMKKKQKRVAGGVANIGRDELKYGWTRLIRGFLPPIRAAISTFKRNDMTIREKLIALCVLYFFKVYTTSCVLGIKARIMSVTR